MRGLARVDSSDSYCSSTADTPVSMTLDEALDVAGLGPYQYRLLVLSSVCWAADAMEMLLLSFLIPYLREDWGLAAGWDGALGAIVFVGIMIGNYVWGYLSDQKGRKIGLLGVAIFAGVFGLLSAVCPSIGWLMLCRFMVGFGIGGTPVAFTLLTEFLPTKSRAKVLVLSSIFWSIGAILEAALAWVILEHVGWRAFIAVSALPLWGVLACYYMIDESPHYYLITGQVEKASALINKIIAYNGIRHAPIQLVHTGVVTKYSFKYQMKKILGPVYKTLTLQLWFIWFVDTFVYYGVTFFTPRFFADEDEYSSVFISTLAEFPGVILAYLLIDRLGRRRTLTSVFSMSGLFILLLCLPWSNGINIFLLFLARMSISAAFNATFIYTTEVYPTVFRSTALGAASAVARVAGILTSFVSQDVDLVIASMVFGICGVMAAMASSTLNVETAHMKLKDTEEVEMEELED